MSSALDGRGIIKSDFAFGRGIPCRPFECKSWDNTGILLYKPMPVNTRLGNKNLGTSHRLSIIPNILRVGYRLLEQRTENQRVGGSTSLGIRKDIVIILGTPYLIIIFILVLGLVFGEIESG